MSKEAFDRKLAAIEALRSAPEDAAAAELRKALKDRSNYVVSKAAAIAAARRFEQLVPDLLAAFDRFLADPVKTDPQCWAKNAIGKALKDLEHTEPEVFLRGLSHVQMEPVWGKRVDTAGTLRGTCAHALVACRMESFEVLTHLTDRLVDAEAPVHIDATRAVAQLGAREGLLPLRLKALAGDGEPEVMGHCFAAVLTLAPRDGLDFVGRFLEHEDPEVRIEAAAAIAASGEPEALRLIEPFYARQTDVEVKQAILDLLAASPLPEAAEYLLSVVEDGTVQTATHAITALANSRHRAAVRDRVAAMVAQNRDLAAAFERAFDTVR